MLTLLRDNLVFKKHAKFIIIDKLTNTTKSEDTLRQRLIERENFWIQKLETLHPKELNQVLVLNKKTAALLVKVKLILRTRN